MVFVLEIRNEDSRNFNKSCDSIFVRFKVVNENGGNTMVVPCCSSQSESESEIDIESDERMNESQEKVQMLEKIDTNLVYTANNNSPCVTSQHLNYNYVDRFEQLQLTNVSSKSTECQVNSHNDNYLMTPHENVETVDCVDRSMIVNLKESNDLMVQHETNNNNNDNNCNVGDHVASQAVSHSCGQSKVPAPNILPRSPNVMDLNIYINRIQEYFNQLGYHRQGEPKIRVNTNMSIKHQIETARALIKAGEPIKCLHALVMAIHFTNCSNHIERFPINFKSEFKGKEYKHVVLGVYLYGMFGALGISRDPGLQDKPAAYTRLVDLIADYHKCYTDSGHFLLDVKVGGIITHDPHSLEVIHWKIGNVSMTAHPPHIELALEKIAKQLRSKMGSTCLRNLRPAQLMFSPELPPSQPVKESTSNRPPLAPVKKSKTSSVNIVGSASSTHNNNKVKKKVEK